MAAIVRLHGKGQISYFWNTFDQVLLRPDLLEYFSVDQLFIPCEIGDKKLLSNERIASRGSDHLPIIVTLQM